MADNFPTFPFTTQEDWYGELSFISAEDGSPLSLEGRNFVMLITPATSGAELVEPKIILTMEVGGGLSLKSGDPSTIIFRVPKEMAGNLQRMEYTADVLEVVGGNRYLFMPARIQYFEPSSLRTFLSRFLGVKVSFAARRQPIITPVAVPGREGKPGATILRGSTPPGPADGKDDDYYIEDRTASGQGRRMWGPKTAGAWTGTPWNIQVAAISDVPGLPDALDEKADKSNPEFTGTMEVPVISITGTGSTGDISKMSVAPDPRAEEGSLARILGRTGGNSANLWFNPDASIGNGAPQVLPNTALNIFGMDGWTFQQTGLNPFETVARTTMPEGDTAIFWMNGIYAAGSNTFSVGTKTVTPAIPNAQFAVGFDVEMVDPNDISKKMFATVTSYDGTTLVLNATSVSAGASGTLTNWVVGRNGYTTKGATTAATTQASPAGSDTLYFADTSGIEVGATIEFEYDANFKTVNGIQYDTYVVSKTPTSIKLSRPTQSPVLAPPGVAVLASQTIRFYGNQGHYGYQDLKIEDTKGLRYGTALARDSAMSFDIQSNVGGKRASIMFLGYKQSHPFIGRAFVQSFEVPTSRQRITVLIPGDKESPNGTWTGAGLNGFRGTLGFAPDSAGSPTSQNIPDGIWKTAPGPGFGIGGSDQQTFQLSAMVGAWLKITAVKWELDKPTGYEAPTTLSGRYPTPSVMIRDGRLPRLSWQNLGAGLNLKKWQSYLSLDGALRFGKLRDDENSEIETLRLNADGSVTLPQYPAGQLSVDATGKIGSTPNGAFTAYTPAVSASAGSTQPTFGTVTGRYKVDGKRVFIQMTIPVPNNQSGAGQIIAQLPPGLPTNGFEWSLVGFDTGFTGNPVFGRLPPNSPNLQIKLINGAYPAQSGSILNLSGVYETP